MSSDVISLEQFPAYLSTQRTLSRYDRGSEKKPNHIWYRMDKTKIDELLKLFSHSIADMLNGSPTNDRELQHLFRTATELANVLRSPPIKVALIGAQGAGKSLSLNALFDCDGPSLTGAGGAACTSSITRYVHYRGEFRFSAEIKFLSAEKREVLLKEHARNYFHYQHVDVDSDDEDTPRRKPDNHDEMERRLKDTAEDVFMTLFGSCTAFQESWSSASYKSGEFIRICQLKCEETLRKEGGALGTAIKLANDQKDLLKQLKPFIIKVKDITWIEIIDLPGWGDSNSRVRHAEEIKDNVDVELILADIIRIHSDDKVINTARAAVAHHGPANVKVITTKIDDAEHQKAQLEDDEDTVNDSKRNRGFETIAQDFEAIFKAFMTRLLSQAMSSFQKASDAFNRILKNRGTVPQGVSKARGLENCANWNKDLASILAPSFQKWASSYAEHMRPMEPAFAYAFDQLHKKVLHMMSKSAANLPTVEKTKKKWTTFHHKVQAKVIGLMEAVARVQTERLEWATMAYDRENNLIAELTDDIYTDVFNTVPALKAPNPKAKKQYKQYVEPKLKFQKRKLADMFLHSDRHFVDIAINHFQGEFDKKMRSTLGEYLAGIERIFKDFSRSLSDLRPISYVLTPEGEAIRADVEERIPELEQKIDNIDVKEDEDNLALIFETMAERKKAEDSTGRRQTKRIKQEPL
ncbi:hypothetical protein E8E12_007724 [Didymella heteroderae]|uniref:Uncharacterized protein n=1 Tax=Didymella heteroderae TaxID=1769908 RepID=A0A9P4WN11_9PLEO|nr:hypothetical protein E8E12_007724 [Didymella heteroderae]